ncbi:MAG: DUF1566 domain-containing protein [Acidimicrobiia bacterium]|nr:DUF1566 domain-containing protein [Acidimicrobiia bacterium]
MIRQTTLPAMVLVIAGGLAACGDATAATSTPTEPTAASETSEAAAAALTYPIVDTGQTTFYDTRDEIAEPSAGDAFFGQDAGHNGNQPSYIDNRDGTVTDNVTGLTWTQTPVQNLTYDEATTLAETFASAGYDDWRLPTIKELYSLILFTGTDPSGCDETGRVCAAAVPFIDTDYFDFEYGDISAGERVIDAQYLSSTIYIGDGRETLVFGVNFADGRIKGYGLSLFGRDKTFDVLLVRGADDYGSNEFMDNGDGTISDLATGLIWTQTDSGEAMEWEQALAYCSALETGDNEDWRLPTVKELQSIVDYTRSPSTTGTAAIDPAFSISEIIAEDGSANYPFLWSSTTHANLVNGANAAYVAFGDGLGWMQSPAGDYTLRDVHGAGAQRSDPKTGDAGEYPYGHGPQGDVIRISNHAVCVGDA